MLSVLHSRNIKMKRSDLCPPFNQAGRYRVSCNLDYHAIIENGFINVGIQRKE